MVNPTITSWAVDLAQVGAIYPWVGSERILYLIGLALWIGFHVWQIRFENCKLKMEEKQLAKGDTLKKCIDVG